MGLFDFFKNKTEPAKGNATENTLEKALRLAATEKAYQPAFYKLLLSENLVVITPESSGRSGEFTLKENTTFQVASLPDGTIPAFTSTQRIFDKGVIKKEVSFLEMKGADLLNVTKGATVFLNPYSDYGKELLPAEIESLINGNILKETHKKITVEKETKIQIGQPSKYPTEIVESLKKLYARSPSVRKAYMAWIYNPSSGEPPHYIFALDLHANAESVFHESGFVARQFLGPDEIVDFIEIDESGLSDYFVNQTKPFYER
jgi:hypothetical protein